MPVPFKHDKRVFHDKGIVIYDPETFDVIESIYPIARSVNLDDIKIQFKGMALSSFDGNDPRTKKRKFINGKIIAIKESELRLIVDAPYFGYDPEDQDILIPAVPLGMAAMITVRNMIDRSISPCPESVLRLRATAGVLSKKYFTQFTGEATSLFVAKELEKNSIVHIQTLMKGKESAVAKIVVV